MSSSENFHCHMKQSYGTSPGECRALQRMQAKITFCVSCATKYSQGKEKKKSDSYILREAGWRRAESLKLSQFIIQHNKNMRRKVVIRSLSSKLWSIPFGNGVSHYNFLKKTQTLSKICYSFLMRGKTNQKIIFWFPLSLSLFKVCRKD